MSDLHELVEGLVREIDAAPSIDFSNGVLRLLLKILRHADSGHDVITDVLGWTNASQLPPIINREFATHRAWNDFDFDDLEAFVLRNHVRLEIRDDRIRARYGHSRHGVVSGVLASPPKLLWHATTSLVIPSILSIGISNMQRTMVHLTTDVHYAVSIHERDESQLELLSIDTSICQAAGCEFYQATSHVWQTHSVPPEAISQYSSCRDC